MYFIFSYFYFLALLESVTYLIVQSGYRSLGGLFVHNEQLIGYLALMFLTSFTAHPASKVQFHTLTRHQVNGLWQSENYISKSTLCLTKIHDTYFLIKAK